MKRRTLLDICNNVALQLRFEPFTNVIGDPSKNAQTVLLAVKQGLERDVFWHHPWSILRRNFKISFAAGKEYYLLPTDFDHIVNDTAWDIERQAPAIGPLDPTEWSALINREITLAQNRIPFTIMAYEEAGGGIGGGAAIPYQQAVYVWPIPESNSSGPALYLMYVSNEKIVGSDGLAKTDFTDDSDSPVLDADLVEHAGYVRGLRILGLQFADEMEELQAALKNRARKDGGYFRMNASNGTMDRSGLGWYPNTPRHVPPGRGRW